MAQHQNDNGLFDWGTAFTIGAISHATRRITDAQDPIGSAWHAHGDAGHSHKSDTTHFHPDGDSSVYIAAKHRGRWERGQTTTMTGRPLTVRVRVLADWDRPMAPSSAEIHIGPIDTSGAPLTYPECMTKSAEEAAGVVTQQLSNLAQVVRDNDLDPADREIVIGHIRDGIRHVCLWFMAERYHLTTRVNKAHWLNAFAAHHDPSAPQGDLIEAANNLAIEATNHSIHDLFHDIPVDSDDQTILTTIGTRIALDQDYWEDDIAGLGIPELHPVFGGGVFDAIPDVPL